VRQLAALKVELEEKKRAVGALAGALLLGGATAAAERRLPACGTIALIDAA
jgi:hypothetical protein